MSKFTFFWHSRWHSLGQEPLHDPKSHGTGDVGDAEASISGVAIASRDLAGDESTDTVDYAVEGT